MNRHSMVTQLLAVLLLLGALLPVALSSEPDFVAVVTDIEDNIALFRSNRKVAVLKSTTFLQADDVLRSSSKGKALVCELYSPFARLGPHGQLTVRRRSGPGPRGALTDEEFLRLKDLHRDALADAIRRSPERQGVPTELIITARRPRFNLVLKQPLTFEWSSVKNQVIPGTAVKFTITVYDHRDEPIWEPPPWQTTNPGTSLVYASGRAPLPPGDYKWRVKAEAGELRGSNTAPFTIDTEEHARCARSDLEAAAKLAPSPDTTNLFYVAQCFKYCQYPEAEHALKQATARTPQDSVLWKLLMRVYCATGLPGERERLRKNHSHLLPAPNAQIPPCEEASEAH